MGDTDETASATDHDSDSDSHSHSDTDTGADVGHDLEAERTTAPMSDYSSRAVGIGFLVLAIGATVAFAVPLLAV